MAVKSDIWIFAVIALVAIYAFGGNLPFLGSSSGGTGGGTSGGTTNVVVSQPDKACGSTTMTVDFTQKYSESTDMTAQNATVYINGNRKGTYSEGGTFTAQGGDTLNVYYALDTAQTTYYAAHATGKIPCTGQTAAFTTSNILSAGSLTGALQSPPDKLYVSSTAATVSVYNKKSMAAVTNTAELSIAAGATETARVFLDWKYEEGYGVADGNTLACKFTDLNIDQAGLIVSLDGAVLPTAKYVPSMTRFALDYSNETAKYWALPAIDGKVTTSSTLDFQIKGDDTNEPTSATNFTCEVLDTDLFQTDSGAVKVGIEDEDDNSNVGRSTEAAHFAIDLQ
jgi:hypothetical protein